MRQALAPIIVAALVIFPVHMSGCSPRASCDLQAAANLDSSGQADTVNGDYAKSVTDFDSAAQTFGACADVSSDGEHFLRLYGEAHSLGGEARSLFQLDDERAQDVVKREISIYKQIADDPNAEKKVGQVENSPVTIRELATLREDATDSSSLGRPMPTPDFATASAAENHCPSDTVVYVEWPSPYFYAATNQSLAREGGFVCKTDAIANHYAPTDSENQ